MIGNFYAISKFIIMESIKLELFKQLTQKIIIHKYIENLNFNLIQV